MSFDPGDEKYIISENLWQSYREIKGRSMSRYEQEMRIACELQLWYDVDNDVKAEKVGLWARFKSFIKI